MNAEKLSCLLVWLLPACYAPDPGFEEATDTDLGATDTDLGAADGSSSAAADESTTGPADDDQPFSFDDTFDADTGEWVFIDDSAANQEGPGQWSFEAGDLVQRSDISGPDAAVPSAGTFAMGGDPDWDTYRIEATLTADDDGVVGVMGHVEDDATWVRFEVDHETATARLVRSTAGVAEVIAVSSVGAAPLGLEVERTLALDCGATYTGWFDGKLVVEAEGSVDAEGAVGLYASSIGDGPNGLHFHEVHVAGQ